MAKTFLMDWKFKVYKSLPVISILNKVNKLLCGPGSVDSIATAYGLDGPGIDSRWGEIFRASPDQPWGPPNLL